jgi:hypothetical protein
LNSTITHSLHTKQPFSHSVEHYTSSLTLYYTVLSPTVEQYNYTVTPYNTATLSYRWTVQLLTHSTQNSPFLIPLNITLTHSHYTTQSSLLLLNSTITHSLHTTQPHSLLHLNSTITHLLISKQPLSPTVEQYTYPLTPYITAPLSYFWTVQSLTRSIQHNPSRLTTNLSITLSLHTTQTLFAAIQLYTNMCVVRINMWYEIENAIIYTNKQTLIHLHETLCTIMQEEIFRWIFLNRSKQISYPF